MGHGRRNDGGRGGQRRQRGVTLLEVLVALVVFALGVLAVAGAQAGALRSGHGAHYRAQAAFIAQDMVERMRGNPGQARNYGLGFGEEVAEVASIADRDKSQWLAQIAMLPAGAGAVEVDEAFDLVRVTVRWDNSRAGGEADERFTLTARIWSN